MYTRVLYSHGHCIQALALQILALEGMAETVRRQLSASVGEDVDIASDMDLSGHHKH